MINLDSNVIKVQAKYLKMLLEDSNLSVASEKSVADAVKNLYNPLSESHRTFKELKEWLYSDILDKIKKQTAEGVMAAMQEIFYTGNLFSLLSQTLWQDINDAAISMVHTAAPSASVSEQSALPVIPSSVQRDLKDFSRDLMRISQVYSGCAFISEYIAANATSGTDRKGNDTVSELPNNKFVSSFVCVFYFLLIWLWIKFAILKK